MEVTENKQPQKKSPHVFKLLPQNPECVFLTNML